MNDAAWPESPRLQEIRVTEVPVTVALGVGATLITAAWLLGANIDWAFMDVHFWRGEPWRLVASIFPHLDPTHLLFNLYWLWRLGTLVEIAFGSARTAGLYVLLAIASSSAQYALSGSGVGLSGVGYGLFGFLLILRKERQAFARVLDFQNIFTFVAWFFICIAMSGAGGPKIGNTAHGAGALAGMLCGYWVKQSGFRRNVTAAVLASLVVASLLGASVFRPRVNFGGEVFYDYIELAHESYEKKDFVTSETYARDALALRPEDADTWFRLGLTLHLRRPLEAADAYYKAWQFDAKDSYAETAFEMNYYAAGATAEAKAFVDAARYYQQCLEIRPSRAEVWREYADVLQKLGRSEDSANAYLKAGQADARPK